MKKRILTLTILLSLNFGLHSQLSVSITSDKTNACVDSIVQFVAKTTNAGVDVNDVHYTWSFGDGSRPISGLNLDTITHKFKKGQGYIVRVDAQKDTETDYGLKQFNVALKPIFEGTKSDRNKPLCLGQQIFLTGKVKNSIWKYKPKHENNENNPIMVSNHKTYSSTFDYRNFKKNQQITDGSEIDTIGIKLEHTDISHVKIELISPNGASLLLKDFGGSSGKDFGLPNNAKPDSVGTPYYYYWVNGATKGKINEVTPSGSNLPKGAYKPEHPFSTITGSPLNGEWQIKVTDNNSISKGFVVAAKLVIKGEQFFNNWTYSNKYINHSFNRPEWLGAGVSSTSDLGLATAIPNSYGNHRYKYKVTDDFGCMHDTSLINNVEAASLITSPDSASGPFNLTIKFESKTSWAQSFEWNFGDRSEPSTQESPEHIYKKHGKFIALLTIKTEDGCSDTASVEVKVTIPPSSLDDIPNAFSPNDDGKNDIFRLQKGTAIKELSCHIYSRWGKRVVVWKSVEEASEKGWDGTVPEGGKASPGVYYYVIKAIGFDGKVYEKKGAFHLFR